MLARCLPLLILLVAFPARAMDWVLALSWQPAWCETQSGDKRARPECFRDYAGPEGLTLHGLWPQGKGKEDCGPVSSKAGRCALPAVPLSRTAVEALAEVMPGALSRLDRHEWAKHGTCSGMSPETYFRTAGDMVRQARKSALGRLLGERAGGKARRSELCAAFMQDFGEGRKGALNFELQRGLLTEIRIRLRGEAPRLDAASIPASLTGDCMRPDDKEFVIDAPGFRKDAPPGPRPACP